MIDASYRGEIIIVLANLSNQDYKIEKVKNRPDAYSKVEQVKIEEARELSETKRGERRFQQTGLFKKE